MVLTTSMVELLCNHIEENISSLFVCFGCLEGYENQLGHECMTYSNGQRISEYGDLAILNMDWDKLVADFVNRNIQMRIPKKLQTDAGKEFVNVVFQKYLKKMKVGFFTTNNKAKASIVERFNRTLKTKMWKYFTEMNTKCYIDVLGKLVYSYNHTWHRSIRMEPSSVSEGNQTQVWLTLYGQSLKESKSIFKVGDTVRISREKLNFEKGYTQNWTREIFTIHQILSRNPIVYRVKDLSGEIIQGTFYPQNCKKYPILDFILLKKLLEQGKGMVKANI
ncbi:putative uncharacterized transposon-derived protein F54H12.3 [Trichonephila clavipes]|uniref:Uncharacterized transposon-derived protein F54H12.3 n=1 Tax=Trichonephila clavipes TaxID=2585209 RepID=A0A8X6VXM7_TRICX|nr:putative uncharacterized transposon-derived protein F54H12.3 [Trichonephila clavipes]